MLTKEQVLKLIASRPKWVQEAREKANRLNVHINGKNTSQYLERIEKIENQDQSILRKKWVTSNRHLFVNLSRPIDKVFSAKGGGNIYNIDNTAKEKRLTSTLSNVAAGKSIRAWIRDIQANKYYTDPAGLVFFEWSKDKCWPTLKPISQIHCYKADGREVEWVIFEPFRRENDDRLFYRVVDEAYDYLYAGSLDSLQLIEDETFKNPFKRVPAVVNSDLLNSDLTHAESPFEEVIGLADHYLRTGSIKNIVEFLHGYPVFWRYLTDCPTCKGTGFVATESGDESKTCPACGGAGVNLRKDVTDVIQIKPPADAGEPVLTPDVAGYVAPPITSWQEMRNEMEYLHSLMELTVWGSKMVKDKSNETATAAFLNVQPVNDRLNSFADAFEDMERKMTHLIGIFLFGDYSGASINYGRRFLVESPDIIWEKYSKARTSGAPKVTLNYLLMQFYQSEYANDIESLTVAMKGVQLEPFVHTSDADLKNLITDKTVLKQKYYFNEWFKTVPNIDLLRLTVDELKALFETFLNNIPDEQQQI